MKRTSHFLSALIVLAFVVVACGPNDEKISAAVTEALKTNPELSPVSAAVKDGVVTLTGEVEADEQKSSAESVVAAVKGVKSVNNSVTVKPKGPSPEELKKQADDALTAKVNANFTTYKVEGVTATVSDSIVTLTGEIKRANLQNAMKAAMESGAKKVDNKLTIKK
ncbi:BON domain-containing protein [Chryseolinea sp. T2]|uniref:BON domain-containing protein n=1 Tax=Chryseolinea sp. T2 TaxID=3129255 RepID=UPI003076CF47